MSLLPTGWPLALIVDPSALSCRPGILAISQMRAGYAKPVITVSTSSARNAAQCMRTKFEIFMSGHPWDELDDEVDQFDADERGDNSADAVDIEVAAQQL